MSSSKLYQLPLPYSSHPCILPWYCTLPTEELPQCIPHLCPRCMLNMSTTTDCLKSKQVCIAVVSPVSRHHLAVWTLLIINCTRATVLLVFHISQEIVQRKCGKNNLFGLLWCHPHGRLVHSKPTRQNAKCIFNNASGSAQPVIENLLFMVSPSFRIRFHELG